MTLTPVLEVPTTESALVAELSEALVQAQDRLLAVYDLVQLRVETLDFGRVAAQIVRKTVDLCAADVSVLSGMSHQRDGSDPALAAWLAARSARFAGGRPRAVSDRGWEAALAPVTSPAGVRLVIGVARAGEPFRTDELKLLGAVAATLTAAGERARLHEGAVEAAVVEREYELASRLAQAAVPLLLPELPGLDLFASCLPAQTAGGDFYCCVALDGRLHFAVGDVAGKGLTAALVMSKVVWAFNACVARNTCDGPVAVMDALDRDLSGYLEGVGVFVTLLVGIYDPSTGSVDVCNAGHSPVLVAGADGVTAVPPSRPPLGIGIRTTTGQHLQLEKGDLLVVGSDGLVEQQAPDGTLYGYPRLQSAVGALRGLPASSVGARLLDSVRTFASAVPASDDRTLLVIGGPS